MWHSLSASGSTTMLEHHALHLWMIPPLNDQQIVSAHFGTRTNMSTEAVWSSKMSDMSRLPNHIRISVVVSPTHIYMGIVMYWTEKFPPASGSRLTATGSLWSTVLPIPNWPWEFCPQHQRLPLLTIAHVWPPPAAIALKDVSAKAGAEPLAIRAVSRAIRLYFDQNLIRKGYHRIFSHMHEWMSWWYKMVITQRICSTPAGRLKLTFNDRKVLSLYVPIPNCPFRLSPQHQRPSLIVIAHVWPSPAVIV